MSLSAFLAQNVRKVENERFVASKRFTENGTPVEWEIRALSGAECDAIRDQCVERVPVPGRKGMFQSETNFPKYVAGLAAAATVFPNLDDAELQDSWGVRSSVELLRKMLTAGEYGDYVDKVQAVCGFDADMESRKEEAKN